MFTRILSVLATLLVAAAALTAVPASASEAPPPPSQAQPQACLDSSRPTSALHKQWQKGFRNRVIRGTADKGCGASGAGKLKSVRVSVARRVGNKCQHVLRNGKLSKKTDCAPRWLVAKGTSSWSLKLKKKLPAGRYTVRTSAVDAAGNTQK